MVDEYESIPKCKGKKSTLLWLRDYRQYVEEVSLFDMYNDDDDDEKIIDNEMITQHYDEFEHRNDSRNHRRKRTSDLSGDTGLDYEHITDFLDSPFYKHWRAFVKLQNIG